MLNTKKIEEAMNSAKITKAEMFKRTGIGRTTFDAILAGSDARISTVEKIAQVLCKPIGYFFDEQITVENNMAGRDIARHDITHIGNDTSTVADLRDQIQTLKAQLADKDKIIKLLESK